MTAAIILAGGEARRFGGGDKCLLDVAGKPILAHILDRLAGEGVRRSALSANGPPERFAAFALPVLPDPVTGIGPAAGLLAGFRWAQGAGAADLLTLPGDTPFPPHGLLAGLRAARGSGPVALARIDGDRRPDMALWSVGGLAALEARIQAGERALHGLADALGAAIADFASPPGEPAWGVNTPEELDALRAALAQL